MVNRLSRNTTTHFFPAMILASLLLTAGSAGWSAQAGQDKRPPHLPVEQLIQKIAANESRLRQEFKQYAFRQEFTLQTIGGRNTVIGELRRISEIVLNDRGQREEKIIYFPPSPLTHMMTPADYHDLAGVQPFALSLEELPKYRVSYVGRERVDELDTYVFDVTPAVRFDPKKININERYFQGRIWVDTEDLVIVKVAGQGVPEDGKNQFPKFETWRENIDKGIWFPTYTYADDILEFDTQNVHIRMVVKLTNYRRFTGTIEVLDEEPLPPQKPPTSPETKPKP